MKINNAQVKETLRELGFIYDTANIHPVWVERLKKSPIIKRMEEVDGEGVIDFIRGWERFVKKEFVTTISVGYMEVEVKVTYVPVLDMIDTSTTEIARYIDDEGKEKVSRFNCHIPRELSGDAMIQYLTLMGDVRDHMHWAQQEILEERAFQDMHEKVREDLANDYCK